MNGVSATDGVLKKMLRLETHALVRYVCVSGLYVCVYKQQLGNIQDNTTFKFSTDI